jgi:protease-4
MRPPISLPGRPGGRRLLLELDLTRGLLEAPPASPLEALRSMHVPTLRGVVEALERAAEDERVAGLVAHVGARQPTLAQSGELRAAVRRFRRTGKRTVCWSESYGELGPGNVGYHLATAFDEVWVQPSGDVGLTGLRAEAVFVRDLLDKVGVQPQIGQRQEYKTAANTFLQSAMTDPHREMVGRIVESATAAVVGDVADGRRLDERSVREVVDAAPLSAEESLARGLVDRVGYRDEVLASLRERLGDVEVRYVDRYGKGVAGVAQAGAAVTHRNRPKVAVVHATGGIHLGRSGRPSPLSGRSIGSDTLGAALRAVGRDDSVRAVVLRIDSPGGSYVASDAIRREVHLLRRTGRPVVASMGNVAGSGGYYIAMPADAIVANAGTLTGSIGVLAGKQVIRDALHRAGVNRESVSAGRYADMFSTQRPFDEDEWRRLEQWLDRVYDDFTAKAAEDRRMPLDRLREVAKGRVWTGADAVEVGLVDRLGGLSEAIDVACARAGLARAEVDVRTMPKVSPLERLRPAENSDTPAAARTGEGIPLLDRLLGALDLPVHGVLTMPVAWRLS